MLEVGTVVSHLNILCSVVVDQKREMGWLVAGGKLCLFKNILRSWQWLPVPGQLSWSYPRSQRDCAVPGRSNATPCLGPLDIVVLQTNNRVWAADIAYNVVCQVFWYTELWEGLALSLGVCWSTGLPRNFGTLLQELHSLGYHGSHLELRLALSLPGPVLYSLVWCPTSGRVMGFQHVIFDDHQLALFLER